VLWTKTTHRHKSAFASNSINGNSGNPGQGLCYVLIRKFTDVFRGNSVRKSAGISLNINGTLQTAADTYHYNFFNYLVFFSRMDS
jgi:hypothetical protein